MQSGQKSTAPLAVVVTFQIFGIRKVCSDYCVSKMNAIGAKCPDIFHKARSLLQNVCRSMKTETAANRKQLLASARHPILLAKCKDYTRAWIITHPVFKPLTFDGIALSLTSQDLQDPLRFQTDSIGSFQILAFRSLKRVNAELCDLFLQNPSENLMYCLTSSYSLKLEEQLAEILLNLPLRWVDLNDAANDSHWANIGDDDDDDDDGDEEGDGPGDGNDLFDINCLVGSLTRKPAEEEQAGKKRVGARRGKRSSVVLLIGFVFVCFFVSTCFFYFNENDKIIIMTMSLILILIVLFYYYYFYYHFSFSYRIISTMTIINNSTFIFCHCILFAH